MARYRNITPQVVDAIYYDGKMLDMSFFRYGESVHVALNKDEIEVTWYGGGLSKKTTWLPKWHWLVRYNDHFRSMSESEFAATYKPVDTEE